MKKEIKLTEIKAKYTKDFETFGKMDPFVVFSISKSEGKTETAQDAGKQPAWKSAIILQYFDQITMIVKSYEEDTLSNQYMGQGTVDLNSLKTAGNLDIKISDKGEDIGIVSCKYTIKNLPPSPMLIIKNIKVSFYRQASLIKKASPYFSLQCGENSMTTDPKTQDFTNSIVWNENLRIRVKDNQKIYFNLLDKEENGSKLFSYDTTLQQFKMISGKKQFYVNATNFYPFGILQFDFETANVVNRQQSVKNEAKMKEQENLMSKINIDIIKGNLVKTGVDAYFKIIVGNNVQYTEVFFDAKQDFKLQPKLSFYGENNSKIYFILYDKNTFSEKLLGNANYSYIAVGSISLPIISGQKKIELYNKEEKSQGNINVTFNCQKIVSKSITLTEIKLKLFIKGDIIGDSEPYIIAKIGGWSARTETLQGQQVTFKKPLQLKFSNQDKIQFEIYDSDDGFTADDKLCQNIIGIEICKEQKGQFSIDFKQDNGQKGAELIVKYTTKNVKSAKKQVKQQSKQVKSNISEKQIKVAPTPQKQKQIMKKEIEHIQVNFQKKQYGLNEDKTSLDKSKIQNSRASKLPALQFHQFGDRIFDKQSAATLQKSIHAYSMPKGARFSSGPKYAGQPSYYVETCFKANSGKGAGFGFGTKKQFPDWMERNMKENPSPGSYFQSQGISSEGFRAKGPTFGISHKYYQKVTIPKQKASISSRLQKLQPLKRK